MRMWPDIYKTITLYFYFLVCNKNEYKALALQLIHLPDC